MTVRRTVVAACAGALGVFGLLPVMLGPRGPAQEADTPAAVAPATGPEIKYLPAIVEGHTIELSHVEILRSGTVEEWRQWAWVERRAWKWVSVSRVTTLGGEPGPVRSVQIDDGATRTAVIGLGRRNPQMMLMPSCQTVPGLTRDLPVWACDREWLRHRYGMYPWAWVSDIPNTTWNGVRVDTLEVGTAPREGDQRWAQARQMLQYEPGTANLVGVDWPGWKGATTWRAAVVDTHPSTRPEDYVDKAEWDALERIDNRDLCVAYFSMFAPDTISPDPGAMDWLKTFRDKAAQVIQDDPKRLGEFVPGLTDRPSGAVPDELQTIEWQELNTRLFLTLSEEQLKELATRRGVILGDAASLTDEQRELLAKIWGVPEFVSDPSCERVQWCSAAFVYGEADNLVVVRQAPGLIKTGWLAYQGFKDAPPAISG